MKLDRIKFATLVAYIVSLRPEYDIDLYQLDQLTDVDCQPVEIPGKADPAMLNELMRAIHNNEKIAAIRVYRSLTGCMLKESKDAVEKNWSTEIKRTKQELYAHLNNYTKVKPLNHEQDNCISTFINNAY